MNGRLVTALAFALALAAATPGQAQTLSPESGVTGTGAAEIKKQPDLMRLDVDLRIDGKDLKDALAKLKDRKDLIKPALLKLGATESSIEFAPPTAVDPDRRAAMERMIRQRMGRRPIAAAPTSAPAPDAAKPATLTISIRADWPLKAADPEQLLLTASELQDKIRAAKLFAPPVVEAAKSEEEEENASTPNYDGEQQPPGEPVFIYVAKITDTEHATALADAFKKARDNAALTAKAAGADLGSLRQVSSTAGINPDQYGQYGQSGPYGNPSRAFQRYMYNLMMRQQRGEDSPATNEALAPQPGAVTSQVVIHATFALK